MGTKRYTFMIVPENNEKLRSFKLPKWSIKVGGILITTTFIAYAIITGLYLTSRSQLKELDSLRNENQIQRIRIYELASKVDSIDNQLSRLKQFNKRLRVITGLETNSEEESPPLGIGGINHGEQTYPILGNLEEVMIRRINSELERIKNEAYLEEINLQDLNNIIQSQRSILASTPSIWPTRGWLTSGFGMRISPFTGQRVMHEGIDIATSVGTPIRSPADGIVSFIGFTPDFGKLIAIDHGYGIVTRYGHCSEIKVKVGKKVKRGDIIGLVGDTGMSTGPHLHYEVRVNGVPVNPKRYILN